MKSFEPGVSPGTFSCSNSEPGLGPNTAGAPNHHLQGAAAVENVVLEQPIANGLRVFRTYFGTAFATRS
jgi:hypothetical protein